MFNGGNHLHDAAEGNLTCCYRKKDAPVSIDEPAGTLAYTIDCHEPSGALRFRAHCYVRNDGLGSLSYGGRGVRLPDPKFLVLGRFKFVIRANAPTENPL